MFYVTIPFTWSKHPRPRGDLPVAPPTTRLLDFGLSARRPLLPLEVVTLFLNRRPRAVFALIESGELRWAFDIRTSRSHVRQVRVLRDSLFEFTGLRPREKTYSSDTAEFADIVRAILPGRPPKAPVAADAPEPALGGTEIARCFSCTPGHVHNLLRENSLRVVPCRRPVRATPLVARASVIEFLKKRRIT